MPINQQLLDKKFYLILSEYPKSGGTWLTTLIGETLDISKRDIYVTPTSLADQKKGFFSYNIRNHPWYQDSSVSIMHPCVIKSHEYPRSTLINFYAHYLHLIRDGRDIIVSKYFYEKDFCLKNGLTKKFDIPFDDYIKIIAHEWKNYITAWQETNVICVKYEDLLIDTRSVLAGILINLNLCFNEESLTAAIENNTKELFRQKIGSKFSHNTFVRKGINGDWKNHFTEENKKVFKKIAGDLLIKLGYETDYAW